MQHTQNTSQKNVFKIISLNFCFSILKCSAYWIGWTSKEVIRTLLIRGNVKINPGPSNDEDKKNRKSLDIVTFNCNGLGKRSKPTRVIRRSENIARNGGMLHVTRNPHHKRIRPNVTN